MRRAQGRMMARLREVGACYAYSKSDGSAYIMPRSDYQRLKADWMAGKAFFEAVGFYGSPMVLKLGDIVAVIDETAEALEAGKADRAQDRKEDAIEP